MKEMKAKHPKDSQVEVTYIVQPPDINSIGTIFGGRVMAWIDLAAAACANRHTRRTCVTASMDALHFISPVFLGDIVILKASVNYVHKTSLEIGVRVEAENPLTGDLRHTSSAYLTFVALDEHGKPTIIPELKPQSKAEKIRYQEALGRRKEKLKYKKQRLKKVQGKAKHAK
ncbi:MAG: acyl-CoA thioesterase [Deltaproteobacteria bacterium CG_4_10_14_0_2_um_filter_43_8]|nr:MAG: acyl-CoA thioesterase [Deltaproteobacteria bacterium CG11_big_fil_rev_8_21_14_0_20_42_23]PJA19277.1 MAG: acyl-CoA thioesterase [Deltaproteobacteria bacterium CG_4_10_14_0_2_um_filter_43_8]PJC63732.1 MAG: acyl-CoA thioesterase [Deltaproteobacteria bacterium CG_4_9_14_0_2_um_filter_42_21]